MGADISTVLNFEGHELTFLDSGAGSRLLRATDLRGPMGGITQQAISYKVAALEEEDRVQVELVTLGGKQSVTFLTPSGALQVMATGRSAQCARLRKVVCDFFVANQSQVADLDSIRKSIATLAAEVAELKRPALRPIQHGSKKYGPADLHLLLGAEPDRLWRDGFSTSAAFLQEKIGRRVPGPTSAGLTTKTVNWCKRNGGEVRRYLKGGKVLTFLPRAVLAKVYDGSEADQLLLTAPDTDREEVATVRSFPQLE